ncbi:archaeal ATPase family protein [Butyrivibrio proteoclasticus B316]|uniref:Archaeal ATPase family protein n=1 Tax=Butyrivibrio proteoclasticus (strain ATCC 51982 / DSM 14932 / B316) TaxID=515622 RepID=E0RVZ4_BUTPB|nr:ATP-binding protein [Butyrivibrio proteoclasticus]ADL35676.1 archaeal ATPase family protein [Butyrivibrio proteoclasticus B316]
MFIGRERELQSLETVYAKEGFGMTVIYGRRRVGKSTLITEFIKEKKAIFYTATKVGADRNLELFAKQVLDVVDPDYSGVAFSSLENVLDILTKRTSVSDGKVILVIDELPYWAEKDEALLSILQKYIDTQWLDKNLMLILCGSALSFMENKVLSEKSPVFGRRDSQIKLEAFNYRDSALFVPNYSPEDKAVCYGVTGGVAKYLAMIDSTKSLDDNIKRLFFNTDGYLFDETKNLLTQEFADVTLVNNIIEQVASGENTLNIIASKVKEKDATVLYSLEKLIDVGLVEKKKCITEEKNKKKTQYVLKDHMFKFWYEFIPKAISVIEMGQGELYYDKVVKPQLHAFMGSVFEEMCRYYTLEHGIQGAFGSFITEAGTWWGVEQLQDDTGKWYQQATDIDVVGLSTVDNTAVIGECKFKNEKIDRGVYETLLGRARLIAGKYNVTKYLLFSLSGFTDWFDTQDKTNIVLITVEDMYH